MLPLNPTTATTVAKTEVSEGIVCICIREERRTSPCTLSWGDLQEEVVVGTQVHLVWYLGQ